MGPPSGYALGANTSRLQRWQVVGNVWEISSAGDSNSIPPVPEAKVLLLVAA